MEIGDRIKELRKALGRTQQELAEKLNLKQATVSGYEKGDFLPSDRTIWDICRVFNVNETWLREGRGDMLIELSRRDQISSYVGKLLGGKLTPIEEALVEFMSETSVEEWEQLSRIIKRLTGKIEKSRDAEKPDEP